MDSRVLAWKIRRHAIEMAHISGGSHIASALSAADIIAVLYGGVMRVFPEDPANDSRDRFILSKGHAGSAVYAALAERGFFSPDMLKTHYADGSVLSGHVSHKNVPGVEVSTGSLGYGPGFGVGMAFTAKSDDKNHKVFVITGDGEMQEGSVWEAMLFAARFKLDNFIMIIDKNNMQALGVCDEISSLGDIAAKAEAFGFAVLKVNGHNHTELAEAFSTVIKGKPLCVVAETVKGKGVSFMENSLVWHYRDPQGEDYERAVKELEAGKPCETLL